MKKLFIAGLFALTMITSAFAASTTDASAKAKEHFSDYYGNAKSVSWKTSDNFEKASFTLNNEKVDVFYDVYGDLVGTSKTTAFDKLPKAALKTLTTKYTFPEFQLKECIEFTTAVDRETNYYLSFESKNETVVLEITRGGGVSVMSTLKK